MSFVDDLDTAWNQIARTLGILSASDNLLHEIVPDDKKKPKHANPTDADTDADDTESDEGE